MLKLLHTADWHLGRRFKSFPEDAQKKLSRARMDVVTRILDVARRNAVHAILCVGDIFDDPDLAGVVNKSTCPVLFTRDMSGLRF